MTRPVLVCATTNPGKVAELAALLGDRVDLRPRPEDLGEVDETAPDLRGNALLKAYAVARATGLPALADDTGLEVEALGGAPGVRSARFAGPTATDAENSARLLRELAGSTHRKARFRTVIAIVAPPGTVGWDGPPELVAEGACDGTITGSERGLGGFGYDALFAPEEGDGRTFAEMSRAEKQAISHRGRALRAALAMWEAAHRTA